MAGVMEPCESSSPPEGIPVWQQLFARFEASDTAGVLRMYNNRIVLNVLTHILFGTRISTNSLSGAI